MDDVHLGEDLEDKDTGAVLCHRYGRMESGVTDGYPSALTRDWDPVL